MRFDLTVNEFVKELVVQHKLVVFGEQFWRPYVHVRDAARAFHMALEAPVERVACQVFNVGDTRENYRKADLLELMSHRIPDADVQRVHKTEDPRDYRVSFERIHEHLGFTVTKRVPDGIEEIATALETAHRNPADPPTQRALMSSSNASRVIIQAGGRGTRLAPTTVLPKPLMPVDERPILETDPPAREPGLDRITIRSPPGCADHGGAATGAGSVQIEYVHETTRAARSAVTLVEDLDEPFS
jgi:hypothetical protein